jgi:DNA methyltransferase 1-associated protein 1
MTSNDVRDMLDLPNTAGPRPAKKQKTVGPRPNLKGLQREVQSLGGNNPIAIVPEVPLFKKRRLANRKPAAHWELRPFRNSARKDELVLRHWRRKAEPPPTATADGADGELAEVKPVELDDSAFAKFNVQVNLPKFDDEQYEAKLKSEDWTKEETDYLMSLVQDFDLRWPLIWDRYKYDSPTPKPETRDEDSTMVVEPKGRTMEDLKARYYDIAAKMMAVHRPVHNMSQAEFSLHQLMTSFNPQQERLRKHFAEMSLARSPEERKEEENLLIELKRIMARSERLNEERKELYARLDAPPSTANVGIYTTSPGLSQLLSQLVTANKSKQRRSLIGPEGASPIAGPSGQQSASLDRRDPTNRESISGPSGANKKGAHGLAERRKLSPEEEALYGVSHHERLTGGPSFRHDKVTRQISNKSVVQQAKITNTLVELEIPLRMVMPTAEVTSQYEQLLASINILLDTKKVADKLDNEIKAIEMQKVEREKRERRERGEPEAETQVKRNGSAAAGSGDVDITDMGTGGQGEGVGASSAEGDDVKTEMERGEKERSIPRSAGGSLHKRSASVLSQMSDKSSKRQKK